MTGSTAERALEALEEGNARFIRGELRRITDHDEALRQELRQGQSPIAAVLSCSDSRVAPSVVFDQRLGDLFVIRVAGNVTPPEVVGSIEYAVDRLGTRLVAVVGHTGCGAVASALAVMEEPTAELTPALGALIDRIRPAVERARATSGAPDPLEGEERARVLDEAMRGNVRDSVAHLTGSSSLLERMVREEGLRIVGGEYSLATGVVRFHL